VHGNIYYQEYLGGNIWMNQWASNKPVISPVNGLKQWDALYLLLINFSLEWDYISQRKLGQTATEWDTAIFGLC
jgi:hypothetical protein